MINNKPVSEYTAKTLSTFAETTSGSGTYRAKYGSVETAITPVTAATEQKSYKYILVVTDKNNVVTYYRLNYGSAVNIK